MKIFIYGIYHPETLELRYIGKANDIQKRLKSHCRDMYRRNYPLYFWMRNLAKDGLTPIIKSIVETDSANWQEAERQTIEKFKKQNANLLNVAAGGDEPYCSKEQRAKNGANNAMNIHSNAKAKHIWVLKRSMGEVLLYLKKHNRNEAYNKTVRKLKLAAQKNRKIFGGYLSLSEI